MKTHVPMNNNTGYLPQVHRWIREKPLLVLMLVGGFLRLLAVIYARGYMASDDHFVVIRVVWEWLNGNPLWFNDSTPVARGVLYQYFIFSFMWILKQIGLTDPSTVMFLNRLLHAAWSMSIIPLVYYGLSKWADERAAWYGGMLVSIHFLIPFLLSGTWWKLSRNPSCLVVYCFWKEKPGRIRDAGHCFCRSVDGIGFYGTYPNRNLSYCCFLLPADRQAMATAALVLPRRNFHSALTGTGGLPLLGCIPQFGNLLPGLPVNNRP